MPPLRPALLDACRTLFGDGIQLAPEFLAYLQPSGAKVAFRTQAKRHHPDRFAGAPPEVRARQTAIFRDILQAYQLLLGYLEQRPPAPSPPHPAEGHRHRAATRSPESSAGVPPLPLEFGLYAYYRGRIDYRALIEALVWQRRQRPMLGAIACQWGWLTEEAVRSIVGHRGSGGRFGRKAVELGLLSAPQVEALLRQQRSRQQRIGQYFIERGLMTAAEAEQLASDLARHNARLAGTRR